MPSGQQENHLNQEGLIKKLSSTTDSEKFLERQVKDPTSHIWEAQQAPEYALCFLRDATYVIRSFLESLVFPEGYKHCVGASC